MQGVAAEALVVGVRQPVKVAAKPMAETTIASEERSFVFMFFWRAWVETKEDRPVI